MELNFNLNCEIHPNIEILNAYNKLYPWIPNGSQIRPSEKNIEMKNILIDKIKREYNSMRDYILINVFNYKFNKNKDKKYQALDYNIKLNKLEVCRFKYNVNDATFHYIMWYTCDKTDLIPKEINRDIHRSIYNILGTDKFKYVYYENPKMSVPDMYHIHVFFIKL